MAETTPTPTTPSNSPWAWYDTMPRALRHSITGTLAALLAVLVVWVGGLAKVSVKELKEAAKEAAAEEVKKAEAPPAVAFGWYGEAETVSVARGMIPTVFRSTPAGENETLPDHVYQWKVHEQVTGKKTPEKDQGPVGSCVGQGESTAAERAQVCAIAGGEPMQFTELAEEGIYAASRVDVGRGQLRGQDGSVGGWAARAAVEIGHLPAAKYQAGDFTTYDPARCKRMGDTGLPAELKTAMADHKAGAVANLKTTLDMRKALASGAGTFVCTVRGYTQERDANGVCRQSGHWGHCMCCDGYATVGGRFQYHLDNSWDHVYHRGPVGPGDPTGTGFYVTESEMAAILAEGDSWAVSAVKGFPSRKLDWLIDARPQPRDPLGVFALAP